MLNDPRMYERVDALAERWGCPLVVEDLEFRVLAYSAVPGQRSDPIRNEVILNRRTPDSWLDWLDRDPERRLKLEAGGVVALEDAFSGLRRRHIKAIRTGSRTVAYLWILEGERGLPDDIHGDLVAFESELSDAISTAILDPGGLAETRLVRLLVHGESSVAALESRGVHPDWWVTAAALGFADGSRSERDTNDLVEAVRAQAPATASARILVGVVGQEIALLRFAPAGLQQGTTQHLREILDRSTRFLRTQLVMAVGRADSIPSTRRSWRQALSAAGVVREEQRSKSVLVHFETVQSACILREVAGFLRARPELIDNVLGSIERQGVKDVPDRSATLSTFLDHRGSIARAAARLNLHQNSLRYRMARILADLPFDLEDPDGWLATQLVARIASAGHSNHVE